MTRTRRLTLLAAAAIVAAIVAVALILHARTARRIALMRADPDTILTQPALRERVMARGRTVYAAHCAACHGATGRGDPAIAMPDLTDDDFLYGTGRVGEIEQIVLHGIRAGDSRGWNLATMPGFARAVPYAREPLPPLTPAQIDDLVAFLRAANGHPDHPPAAVDRGRRLYGTTAGCWDCHGHDAGGDPAIGAPNLVDGRWLKGDGGDAAIRLTLERGLAGVSPAFARALSPTDARAVAAYVASLHPPAE